MKSFSIKKSAVLATLVLVLSSVGFGTAFGYGRSGQSVRVQLQPTVTTTTGGQVLGASAFNFSTDLTVGSTGDAVTALQETLIADIYLKIDAPTGYFGPMTLAAVKLWQAAHGVPATGYVGPLTRAALNSGSLPTASDETKAMASVEAKAQLAKALEQLAKLQAAYDAAVKAGTLKP
ncbi:MAG: peptidoglycan-binding domain-containing protein [bacterium]